MAKFMTTPAGDRTRAALKRIQARKDTAGSAFERNRSEVLRKLELIQAEVLKAGRGRDVHWGDVGDMAEVNSLLNQVAHWAGAKLTEQ